MEVLEACRHHGIGVVPYSPLARGVLAGKYLPGQTPAIDSRAGRGDKRMLQTEFRAESLEIAQQLQTYCEGLGVAMAHFATAWVLANRGVSSVIAGPRTLGQWQDYQGALDCVIVATDALAKAGIEVQGTSRVLARLLTREDVESTCANLARRGSGGSAEALAPPTQGTTQLGR
jgi:aryl-alcohol dehydrogenase-like predicted oxidoreductase